MVEVNLLPKQYRNQTQPSIWKYATWALLPITAAALLIPWIMTSAKTSDLQNQIDAVQGDIDAMAPLKNDYTREMTRQQDLQKTTQVAEQLRDQKTYWSNDLAAFSQQIPTTSGVALTKLAMVPMTTEALTTAHAKGLYPGKDIRRELTLSGVATSQQAVINFLNTFENSPNFGVNFQGMSQDTGKTDQYNFTAQVGVVGAAPAASATSGAGTATGAAGTTSAGTPGTTTPPAATPAPASAPAGGTNVK